MKMKMSLIMLLIAAMAIMPLTARWQNGDTGRNNPCQCNGSEHKTVTLEGTVTEVVHSRDGKGRFADGIHLIIRDGKESKEIHLGPREWLEKEKFSIKKGETVKIDAFQCDCNKETSIMAREIHQGDQSLRLRDDNGRALWSRSLSDGRGSGMNRKARGRRGCGGGCAGCGSRR